MKSKNWNVWQQAINIEMSNLLSHNTYTLVDRPPPDTQVVSCRWVFSKKKDHLGNIIPKARLVAGGFVQHYGDTYQDTYAPMSRMTSVRCMMQPVANYGFITHQLDITTAFLNADLDYTIFMEQPPGSIRDPSKVCLLHKSIYGLHQSAKLWNDNIDDFLKGLNFKRNNADLCLYMRRDKRGITFVILWVDDVVIAENLNLISNFINEMSKVYKVKNLGCLK